MKNNMKNKTINVISATTILGLMMAIILLPSNAHAGVLMTDSFVSISSAFDDAASLTNSWFDFDNSEKFSSGVLMSD